LMAFVCQEIKGLLTYLLTYLFSLVISTLAACRLHDSEWWTKEYRAKQLIWLNANFMNRMLLN